jgi:3-dehydroquinate synthase
MKNILNAGNHPVTITNAPEDALRSLLAGMAPAPERLFVLCDEHTSRYCHPVVEAALPSDHLRIVTGAGERNKTLHTATTIWEFLLSHQAGRNAVMLNLGGGMVTDLGGFAAALFKRGIRFINMPTSLLAMVDASCGGKTGVDLNHYKNMVGLFSVPQDVIVSPVFLSTLPESEWRNGMAEILKHGLIADAGLWKAVADVLLREDTFGSYNQWPVMDWIERAIAVKAEIVTLDPYEHNERKLLNFGHTIGHALETRSLQHDDTPLSHGMAVACGMICEAYISSKLTGLSVPELDDIADTIVHVFRPASIRKETWPEIIHIMKADKKSSAGSITFSLLRETGAAVLHRGVDAGLLHESFHFFNSRVV